MKKILLLAMVVIFLSPLNLQAHSGGTNSAGCHNDWKRGGYHCHSKYFKESEKDDIKVKKVQDVYVRGYTKKNGTYVKPHYRTRPNDTIYDNYSTRGNRNPYTGKSGTVDPYSYKSGSNSYNGGFMNSLESPRGSGNFMKGLGLNNGRDRLFETGGRNTFGGGKF